MEWEGSLAHRIDLIMGKRSHLDRVEEDLLPNDRRKPAGLVEELEEWGLSHPRIHLMVDTWLHLDTVEQESSEDRRRRELHPSPSSPAVFVQSGCQE